MSITCAIPNQIFLSLAFRAVVTERSRLPSSALETQWDTWRTQQNDNVSSRRRDYRKKTWRISSNHLYTRIPAWPTLPTNFMPFPLLQLSTYALELEALILKLLASNRKANILGVLYHTVTWAGPARANQTSRPLLGDCVGISSKKRLLVSEEKIKFGKNGFLTLF